jgi:predicted MFS family arabinose efflux permease
VIGFPAVPRQIDRTASLVALLLVATVTEAMFLLLPSFVGALGDVLHLSATRTGLLASADLTGIALTTATAPWWLRRVSWRRTVLASLLAFLLINLVCFAVRSFWPLLCLRLLAGLSALYGTASHMALAVGPYVGGSLIVDRSYTPLLWFGVIAASACYACFLAAIRLGRAARDAPRTTPPAHPCH